MKRPIRAGLVGLSLFLSLTLGQAGASHAALTRVNLPTELSDATVLASHEDGVYVAENAIDGSGRTRWDSGMTASVDNPCWITVDLGGIYEISKVSLQGATPGQKKLYSVSLSTDNSTWTEVLPKLSAAARRQKEANGEDVRVLSAAEPLLAQYVRYEVFGGNSRKTARLGELKILGDSTKQQVPLPAGVWLLGSGMALMATLRRCGSVRMG